jgi:hypothetical protein
VECIFGLLQLASTSRKDPGALINTITAQWRANEVRENRKAGLREIACKFEYSGV